MFDPKSPVKLSQCPSSDLISLTRDKPRSSPNHPSSRPHDAASGRNKETRGTNEGTNGGTNKGMNKYRITSNSVSLELRARKLEGFGRRRRRRTPVCPTRNRNMKEKRRNERRNNLSHEPEGCLVCSLLFVSCRVEDLW